MNNELQKSAPIEKTPRVIRLIEEFNCHLNGLDELSANIGYKVNRLNSNPPEIGINEAVKESAPIDYLSELQQGMEKLRRLNNRLQEIDKTLFEITG